MLMLFKTKWGKLSFFQFINLLAILSFVVLLALGKGMKCAFFCYLSVLIGSIGLALITPLVISVIGLVIYFICVIGGFIITIPSIVTSILRVLNGVNNQNEKEV